MSATITVKTTVQAPVEQVWNCWTEPHHIIHWNFAADSWACPAASNDLTPNGKFSWRMEAKDGSMGFDYSGRYLLIEPLKRIEKVLDDGRSVIITFEGTDEGGTLVSEVFEVEDVNGVEMQRQGWQAILENFRSYVETQS